MVAISIKDDLNALKRDLGIVAKHVIPNALPKVLNRVGKSVQSVAIKTVSKETKVKQKIIRKAVAPRAFTASKTKPFFIINFKDSKASNLIDFVTNSRKNPQAFRKRTRKGFKYGGVIANAWGERKEYKGTFIGRGAGSGKTLVFKRNARRIEAVAGPSPRLTFEQDSVRTVMKAKLKERLPIELSSAVNQALRKYNR